MYLAVFLDKHIPVSVFHFVSVGCLGFFGGEVCVGGVLSGEDDYE